MKPNRRAIASEGLNVREKAFVDALLAGEAGVRGNATAAARVARYSTADTGAGGRLLKVPAVKAAIEAHYAKHGINRDRVLHGLAALAFSDVREMTSWGAGGRGAEGQQ